MREEQTEETYLFEQLVAQLQEKENIILWWEKQAEQWKEQVEQWENQNKRWQELQQELENCKIALSKYQGSQKMPLNKPKNTPNMKSKSFQQLEEQLLKLQQDYQKICKKLSVLENNNLILSKNNENGQNELLSLEKNINELAELIAESENDNEIMYENCERLAEALTSLQNKLNR